VPAGQDEVSAFELELVARTVGSEKQASKWRGIRRLKGDAGEAVRIRAPRIVKD
jgi:hypothetical protein